MPLIVSTTSLVTPLPPPPTGGLLALAGDDLSPNGKSEPCGEDGDDVSARVREGAKWIWELMHRWVMTYQSSRLDHVSAGRARVTTIRVGSGAHESRAGRRAPPHTCDEHGRVG